MRNIIKESKKNIIKILWFIFMWIGILIFIMNGLKSHGISILSTLHGFDNDTFMDFFNSMAYENRPYENKVIYPPLVNLFYYILHSFVPEEIFYSGMLNVRDSQMGRVIIGMYISVTTILFGYMIIKIKKGIIEEKLFMTFTLLFSMPFLFQLERANMIFISVIFLGFYIYGYDSEKIFVRHIAFISLAIAASIKIYPVFFGLLLIREKRWKDSIICIIYGIILFFVPFVFFGGIDSIKLFIDNIINCTNYMSDTGEGLKLNISNTVKIISYFVCGNLDKLSILTLLLKVFCLFGGVVLLLFAKFEEKWKLYMVPSLMMVLIPDFSFLYTLVFFAIPLAYFLDEECRNKRSWLYLIMFIIIMVPFANISNRGLEAFANDYYPLTWSIVIISIVLLLFMIILWCDGIYTIIKSVRTRKK